MNVHVLPAGPISTNAYLLTAPHCGEAVLIDAPGAIWGQIQPLLASERCRLTQLWLTHGHWDHIDGAPEVIRATRARVSAHPADRVLIETPEIQLPFALPGLRLEPIKVDRWLKAGERIDAFGQTVEVRAVPGHCPGNVVFYFSEEKAAFVGDAIFAGSIGRTDLIGGSFEELERSIREQIYTLPPEVVIFPGHGPQTTVQEEMHNNPYVSVSS
jgi:hydroxyacylglutathione hydrolase